MSGCSLSVSEINGRGDLEKRPRFGEDSLGNEDKFLFLSQNSVWSTV